MKKFVLLFLIYLLVRCNAEKGYNAVGFYVWKSKAEYSSKVNEILTSTKTKSIHIHYFDIVLVKDKTSFSDNVYPKYVIEEIDSAFQNFEITPSIYITNETIKSEPDLIDLAENIYTLVNQISEEHFNKKINKLQVDCDWTQSTRENYFKLLELLKKKFKVSCTLRLHQIKYKAKTGIPPVDDATLMVYNVGDLKNTKQNSILTSSLVSEYINSDTEYPIRMNIALPLFSQTVIKSEYLNIRLIPKDISSDLEKEKTIRKLNDNLFTATQFSYYENSYISKGDTLKIEKSDPKEIIESFSIIKNSKLIVNDLIFYQLENVANTQELNSILTAL